jgi:tetratricopeptide (TPR) repeat protein
MTISIGIGEALTDEFTDSVGGVIEAYFGGLYQLALERAKALATSSGDFASTVGRSFATWLETWDVVEACTELTKFIHETSSLPAENTWARVQVFYARLFIGLICSRESRNLLGLQEAERATTSAILDLDNDVVWAEPSVSAFFDLQRFEAYFPPPWSVYWFRALARNSIGRIDEARDDWEQAYNLIWLAASAGGESSAGGASSQIEYENVEAERVGAGLQGQALNNITYYAEAHLRIAARFLSDLGSFCFQRGDWGWNPREGERLRTGTGALAFYDAANAICNRNKLRVIAPYVWTSCGEFYSYVRLEHMAVRALERAFKVLEEERERANGPFFATGRVYFQLGMLAFKYQNQAKLMNFEASPSPRKDGQELKFQGERIAAFNNEVNELKERSPVVWKYFQHPEGPGDLFSLAVDCYLSTKDPLRAASAYIMMTDPLRSSDIPERVAARSLLWEFIYGFGTDFVGELAKYQNLITQNLVDMSRGPKRQFFDRFSSDKA